ncbi:SNF2 helicase associated [Saccharicrinis carchari]|uniref:SNF2 helicase associated n=1 Tax=Saccharicrinis carchari TaxID=1168039 RepID=A0A521ALL5_SACCC|nr:DEAD/DEAH box helicase [Saccharicrinis carchari]SMO35696.1 SNF2 helicase associated [Saccharicrinis carchari]
MELQDYIDRYIRFKASDRIVDRGIELYNQGAVSLKYANKASDTWHFKVQGGQKYSVIIRDVSKGDLKSTCTCPFDWGTICKHTVAALMFIKDGGEHRPATNAMGEAVQQASSLRTARGYLIENYRFISKSDIEEHTSVSVINDILHGYNNLMFSQVVIDKDKITFEYSTFHTKQWAAISYHNGKVYISSDSKKPIPKLNKVEAYTLLMIAESETPDLLDIIFGEKLNQKKKIALQVYGLSEEADFDRYFYYSFNPKKGLTILFRAQQEGMLPVDPGHKSNFRHFIDDINNEELQLESVPQKNEERAVGFVVQFNEDDYYDYNARADFRVIAVVGKPNKDRTKLSSHIERYDEYLDADTIKLSANAEELLRYINKLNQSDNEKAAFSIKRRIVQLLSKEKILFLRSETGSKIKKSELRKTKVLPSLVTAKYVAFEDDTFVGLRLMLSIDGQQYDVDEIDIIYRDCHVYLFKKSIAMPATYTIARHMEMWRNDLKMVKTHKQHFFDEIVMPLSRNFEIDFGQGVFNIESVELDFRKKQVFLSELHDFLIITPQVEYHNGVSVMLNQSGHVLVDENGELTEYKRNIELEDDFVNAIAELHPYFEEQVDDKRFYLHYDTFARDMWFYRFFERMQHMEVEVFGLKELKNFKFSPYAGKVSTSISSGQDWFEVDVKVSFGDSKVKLKDIKNAVLNKQKYIQLKDGSVGMLPTEWMHKLEKFFRHGEIKDDKLAVSKMRFSIIDELFEDMDNAEIMDEIAQKRQRLAGFKEISNTAVPAGITAELRPYQKEGLNWLNFLHEMGWGGILADDMGLGKTVQVLAFLQHVLAMDATPNIIIVPTTLLFNWENEIAKFAPGLKAYYHYGLNRTRDSHVFSEYDLVFTTYGVLLRDIEMLMNFKFNYAVLDESQAIKNPASRRFKAANLIDANNRIALSGTPIENSTFDLYAQMSFVNKGFFGGATGFRAQFSNAIDKEGDDNIAAELQRLINPFILRRTKEKVASELPPKTEDVIYCEMESEQRKIYDAYRNEYKNKLLEQVENKGIENSKLMVLEALTRMRQICDSPALLNDDSLASTESVKIKEIVQVITDKTGKHKILIFSQFVKMLGLIKTELNRRNIDYEYLDGKSTAVQREKSVNNFQENEDLRVFLISLKAGGTGLNLTAADYVYIVDPWWNPAVENQAIDRCYRIGQDKKVFAYRMICKDTVEEKILLLQNKKKKIAGDIVQSDENILKTLQPEDIRNLFS